MANISTGFSQGYPLNCQAGPITNTATTLSQSLGLSFAGLSTTLYGTETPFRCLCSSTSLSRFAPSAFFCSIVTNLKDKISNCPHVFELHEVSKINKCESLKNTFLFKFHFIIDDIFIFTGI